MNAIRSVLGNHGCHPRESGDPVNGALAAAIADARVHSDEGVHRIFVFTRMTSSGNALARRCAP